MILAISVDPGTSRMLFKLKAGCLSVGALNPLGNRNGASCRNLDSREMFTGVNVMSSWEAKCPSRLRFCITQDVGRFSPCCRCETILRRFSYYTNESSLVGL